MVNFTSFIWFAFGFLHLFVDMWILKWMPVYPRLPSGRCLFIIFFAVFSYYDSVTSPNYHKSVLPNRLWGKWMLDLCHEGNWSHFWPHLSSPLQANFFERGMKWSGSLPVNGTSTCGFAQWQSLRVCLLPSFCSVHSRQFAELPLLSKWQTARRRPPPLLESDLAARCLQCAQ